MRRRQIHNGRVTASSGVITLRAVHLSGPLSGWSTCHVISPLSVSTPRQPTLYQHNLHVYQNKIFAQSYKVTSLPG